MAGITDKEIRGLILKAKREGTTCTQADGLVPGLTVTASKTGIASWVLRYRIAGKQREITIGQFPVWGAADAREKGKELRRAVDQGVDVATEKQQAKLARETAWTVDQLATSYLDKAQGELAPHTWKQRKRQYDKYIKPHIGTFPAQSVTPNHIVQVVAKSQAGGKTLPRTVLIGLTQIFHHAVGRAVVLANPCRDVKETAVVGKVEPPKNRIALTAEELSAFLPALKNMPRPYELAIRIILLTGVRVNTLAEAKVEEFHTEDGVWAVPHERRKNRKYTTGPFVIPLPEKAVAWIKELMVLADRSEYLLPVDARRHTDKRNPLSKRTTLGDWLDRICQTSGRAWRRITPHDLRSTCKSWLSELRVDYETRQRYLDHALEGMDAVYDKADYMHERLIAAERWLEFLDDCEAGKAKKKVLRFRPAA